MASVEPRLGYILHTRPFKDSSAVIEFFSKEAGILSLVAKGARRPRSRLYSLLQPFMLLQVSWVGRGELKTLTHVDAEVFYAKLREQKILLGLYLNELLIRLLQRMDPHPKLFDYYDVLLNSLALTQNRLEQQALLRGFELNLLAELGYGLDLSMDAKTHAPIEPELLYSYDPTVGLYETSTMIQDSSPLAVSGACIISLHKRTFATAVELNEAKKLMRSIISYYLGNKSLQTRKLFQSQY